MSTSCTSTAKLLHQTETKLHKKNSSEHTHAGSSFEEHVARVPTMKTELNFDTRSKNYDFLKIWKLKWNAFTTINMDAFVILSVYMVIMD